MFLQNLFILKIFKIIIVRFEEKMCPHYAVQKKKNHHWIFLYFKTTNFYVKTSLILTISIFLSLPPPLVFPLVDVLIFPRNAIIKYFGFLFLDQFLLPNLSRQQLLHCVCAIFRFSPFFFCFVVIRFKMWIEDYFFSFTNIKLSLYIFFLGDSFRLQFIFLISNLRFPLSLLAY